MQLRQFAGEHHSAIRHDSGNVVERVQNAMRGFVENKRAGLRTQWFKHLAPLRRLRRQETAEPKGIR